MEGRQQQGNATIKQNKNHLHLWVDAMAIPPPCPLSHGQGEYSV